MRRKRAERAVIVSQRTRHIARLAQIPFGRLKAGFRGAKALVQDDNVSLQAEAFPH
jgi:hypothetical protein